MKKYILAAIAAGAACFSTEAGAQNISQRDIDCIAMAVHHEAQGEPQNGKIAVAQVILNRTRSRQFGGNACNIVLQKGQFSFVRHDRIPPIPQQALENMRRLVINVINGRFRVLPTSALFFHAISTRPNWGRPYLARIGGHLFYA